MVSEIKRNTRLPPDFKPPKRNVKQIEESDAEATLNDIKTAQNRAKKRPPSNPPQKGVLPKNIDLRKPFRMLRDVVPGVAFRCSPFKFAPKAFGIESELLNTRFIEPSQQQDSLALFLNNPRAKMIYCVAGNPDDVRAKYFAAYLVSEHIKTLGVKSNVIWHSVTGGFENPVLERAGMEPPSMLVLTNLTPNATNVKLEKARDLLEKYSEIPRIVVVAGSDPISFMATKLYMPVHGVLYLADSLVKRKIEVI